jgi:hypothetical protein
MIRSQRTPGQSDSGPDVLYVAHYLTDTDPDQPVQVKRIQWTGGGFAVVGAEFRIGDINTPDEITPGSRFWIGWRRDARRWYPMGGGGEGGGGDPPDINVATHALVTLNAPFDYVAAGGGVPVGGAAFAPVRSVDGFWGIGTPAAPTITEVFDYHGSFMHHRAGDQVLVHFEVDADTWIVVAWERCPQLLWAFDDSPSAVDGQTIVHHNNGVFPAQVIRYNGTGNPHSNNSYAVTDSEVSAFFIHGSQAPVYHKQRLSGFWVSGAVPLTRTYAVTSVAPGSTEPIPVIIHRKGGAANAIDGAERIAAGPTIRPREIAAVDQQIEKLERDAQGDFVPGGQFLDCEYWMKEPVPNPPEGHVWNGEVHALSNGFYRLIPYCGEWEE